MKKFLIALASIFIFALAMTAVIPLMIVNSRTSSLNTDYEYLKTNENFANKVEVEGVELVTQHISCGYATIEMMSTYYGKTVTEDQLDKKNNGSVSTSSSGGFLNEINSSIPSKTFVMESYLQNDIFLKQIYNCLEKGKPIAIEWAAKYNDEWTLHFSVVTALDLRDDNVTINNPYGYVENITLKEFLSRTSFEAYERMSLFLTYGFGFGAFDKNVIFYAR